VKLRSGERDNGFVGNVTPSQNEGQRISMTDTMVHYKFKCNCGYKLTAIEPQKTFESFKKCPHCGSKEFEKKVIKTLP